MISTHTKENLALQSQDTLSGRGLRLRSLYIYIACAIALELIPVRLGGARLNVLLFCLGSLFVIAVRIKYLARQASLLRGPLFFLLGYSIYIGTSSLWSDIGMSSMADALPILLCCLAAASLADYRPADTAKGVVLMASAICLLSWPLGIAAPDLGAFLGPGWRLNGVMNHPQRLTLLLGFALTVLLVGYAARYSTLMENMKLAGLGSFLLLTLLAAQARAFTTFLLLTLAFVVARKLRSRGLLVAVLGIGMVAIFLGNFKPDLMGMYTREDSNTDTLSGRTTIWENTYEAALERPMMGSGFGSFRSERTAYFFSNYVAPHAHNDALNIFYESGAIGVLFIIGFLLTAALKLGLNRLSYSAPLLLFILLCGTTGVLLGGKISTPLALLVLVVCQELKAKRAVLVDPASRN